MKDVLTTHSYMSRTGHLATLRVYRHPRNTTNRGDLSYGFLRSNTPSRRAGLFLFYFWVSRRKTSPPVSSSEFGWSMLFPWVLSPLVLLHTGLGSSPPASSIEFRLVPIWFPLVPSFRVSQRRVLQRSEFGWYNFFLFFYSRLPKAQCRNRMRRKRRRNRSDFIFVFPNGDEGVFRSSECMQLCLVDAQHPAHADLRGVFPCRVWGPAPVAGTLL